MDTSLSFISSWMLPKPGCYVAIQTQHALHGRTDTNELGGSLELQCLTCQRCSSSYAQSCKSLILQIWLYDVWIEEAEESSPLQTMLMKYLWPLLNNCCSFFSVCPRNQIRLIFNIVYSEAQSNLFFYVFSSGSSWCDSKLFLQTQDCLTTGFVL